MGSAIHNLKLFERFTIDEMEWIRAPDGWIVKFEDYQGYNTSSTKRRTSVVFVPYSTEFLNK